MPWLYDESGTAYNVLDLQVNLWLIMWSFLVHTSKISLALGLYSVLYRFYVKVYIFRLVLLSRAQSTYEESSGYVLGA